MIRRLRLEAWRAFASLDITLEDGVTFVVAENGIGKTSLMEAAAWGIYGHQSGVDGAAARRKDGDAPATVTVDLELPDGRDLLISRTSAAPADAVAELDGAEFSGARLNAVLREAFGAEIDYLSRVTVLPTDVLRSYSDESFQLRRHLCHVYGIDALESAAGQITRYLSTTAKETKRLRSDLQARIRDETSLSAELVQLQDDLLQLEGERNNIQGAIAIGERHAALRTLELESGAANNARWAALTEIATEITEHLGLPVDPESLTPALDMEDERLTSAIDAARREQSAGQGRLDSITEALSALRSADAECPICRRPLSEEDAVHAETAHAQEAASLTARLVDSSAELADLTSRQQTLRAIRRRIEAVPAPMEVNPVDAQGVGPGDLAELRARARTLSETLGALKATESQLERALADSVAAHSEQARAVNLYRREAIATATKGTLEATVSALLAANVEPVAQEVTARWKRIFGERGSLELSPDGELSLSRGSFVVPFEDFSSGEKVVALLTARLLIATASTRASFLWLDEPLEHLDPANRRVVASLLATATGPLRQVVVTTYEEPLARRLAEQIPLVHLTYVRALDE